jgi:hypothetical protein
MTQFPQNSKDRRSNISLTGDGAILLHKLHSILRAKNKPVNVSLTDVVCLALAKLEAELENN